MMVRLVVLVLVLVLQTCSCTLVNKGCMNWIIRGDDSCCQECYPGHRLVKECGRKVIDLCTPCEPGTFASSLNETSCKPCRQCGGGAEVLKNCTPTSDTQCGCRGGMVCSDDRCSSCVHKCPEGYDSAGDGPCRPCPDGTFNDRRQVKCKPWSTSCLKPNQHIVAPADASTDIRCADLPKSETVVKPETHDAVYISWLVVVLLFAGLAVTVFIVSIIVAIVRSKKQLKKPIIRPPSDDPQTLIAIECSFHEAEQEQGSSSESLDSKDSSEQLI